MLSKNDTRKDCYIAELLQQLNPADHLFYILWLESFITKNVYRHDLSNYEIRGLLQATSQSDSSMPAFQGPFLKQLISVLDTIQHSLLNTRQISKQNLIQKLYLIHEFRDSTFIQHMLLLFVKLSAFGKEFIIGASNSIQLMTLLGYDFNDQILVGIQIVNANISGANFIRANLSHSKLIDVQAFGCDFTDAVLDYADWREIDSDFRMKLNVDEEDDFTSSQFSPAGKLFAYCTAQWDHTRNVKILVLETFKQSKPLKIQDFPLSFSSDSALLATTGQDSSVNVWNTQSCKKVFCQSIQQGKPLSIKISPNNSWIAIGILIKARKMYSFQLIDTKSWIVKHSFEIKIQDPKWKLDFIEFSLDEKMMTFGGHSYIFIWFISRKNNFITLKLQRPYQNMQVAFSPKGGLLSTREGLFSIQRKKYIRKYTSSSTMQLRLDSFCFSESGRKLIIGCSNKIIEYSVESGRQIRALWRIPEADNWSSKTTFITRTSQQDSFLIAEQSSKQIKLFRLGNQFCPVRETGLSDKIIALSFSNDGQIFASGSSDHSIQLWDPEKGSQIDILYGHNDKVSSLVFSKNGKYLASGGADAQVRLWFCEDLFRSHILKRKGRAIDQLAFSPNSNYLACLESGHQIQIWNTVTLQLFTSIQNSVFGGSQILFRPDAESQLFTMSFSEVIVWNLDDQQQGRLFMSLQKPGEICKSIAISPDGNSFALVVLDISDNCQKRIDVWDVRGNPFLRFELRNSDFNGQQSFSPNSLYLASSGNHRIQIWDAQSADLLQQIQLEEFCTAFVFSPNSQYLVSSSIKGLQIWMEESVKEKNSQLTNCYDFAQSPDGKFLASKGKKTIFIFDVFQAFQTQVFYTRLNSITCLAFTSDSTAIAACDDERIIVWNVKKGIEEIQCKFGSLSEIMQAFQDIQKMTLEEVRLYTHKKEEQQALMHKEQIKRQYLRYLIRQNIDLNRTLRINFATTIAAKVYSKYHNTDMTEKNFEELGIKI